MGQGQSAGSAGQAAGSRDEIKTSYYELLGVERQATDAEYVFSLSDESVQLLTYH